MIVSGMLIKKGAGYLLHSDQLNHLDTKQLSSVLELCYCRINSNSTAYLLLSKVDVRADSWSLGHCVTADNYGPVCAGTENHRHLSHSHWNHLWVPEMVGTL